jgi:CHAD domain-containing protein
VVVGIAATAALRVGVAAAIAERDRRAAQIRRQRERQFALQPGEHAVPGLRRMAVGQFDLAIEMLTAENGAMPTAEAVHETRKALKRLRTLVRLLERELGVRAAAREQILLREAGRRLAGARDAEVLVGTLEQLQLRHPRKLRRPGVVRLHKRLLAEREEATARLLGDQVVRAQVLSDLRGARARMDAWAPAQEAGIGQLERPLRRIYLQGRRRHLRALYDRGDRALAMHQWRKRVKDLRYAAEALSRPDPHADDQGAVAAVGPLKAGRKRPPVRTSRDLFFKLARRADVLGEALGEEHDLFLLAERVRHERGGSGRRTRRKLLRLIARRRRRLTTRALRDGARLYGRRPRKLVGRVRSAYARAAQM